MLVPRYPIRKVLDLFSRTGVSSPDEKLSCDPEPRSGERYIAWGVSPRKRARIKEKAAERRQKFGADAIGSRRSTNLSPPPGACDLFAVPTLGLTPQAKNMPLLRSSSSGVNLIQDETGGWIEHPASGAWAGSVNHFVEVLGQAGAITVAEIIESGTDAFHHFR